MYKKFLKKISNFKAPGTDSLSNVILKKISNLHTSLCNLFNDFLSGQTIPTILSEGHIILLQKKDQTNFDPANYHPITCLSNIWKAFSSCRSEAKYQHLTENKILSTEQKWCFRKSLSTIDQLLIIHKAITKYAKQHQLNLHVAWIDFKKAYDSLSHHWIHTCLEYTITFVKHC